MATITLKYQKNQSQEVRIEKLYISSKNGKWTVENEKDSPSFFLEEYKEAIDILNGILSLSSNENKKIVTGKENDKRQAEKSINNRILFVGQRGTGKTSAMKSFADGLDKAENDRGNAFTCIPMIDPSNFDNNTNILLTVITMMFSEAKNLMNKKNDDEDVISQRENLLKKFDDVFKSLKAILGSDKPSFNLEGLNEKSLALKMHSGMHDLVKNYLNFYNTVNETHVNRLVLLIDDIDMTVSHAPEMLEQLRKYLDIENVIILMSANLAQLYNEMREHYSQAFKETLKDRNQALYIDVEDLANKYLLKLFPTSRRVRVEHSVKQLIDANLEIDVDLSSSHIVQLSDAKGTFYGNYEMKEGGISGSLDYNSIVVDKSKLSEIKEKQSIKGKLQNVILSLIWEKTRLLFIPKDADNVLHPIIPTNLRELMQFLDMLISLKEVKYTDRKLFEDSADYDNCKDNVAKFKKYFLHNWIPSHLPVEEELVFDNIPTDITEINKHLINSINVIGTKHKADLMSRQVGLDIIERNADNVFIDRDIYTMVSPNDPKFIKANKISDIFNQPSNYSYGDLLLMIDKYETYFESGDNRKFTDAIKIYYSILLFETMFFGKKEVSYIKPTEANPKLDDLLIPIQQLIGGTVYYPNYFEIIEDKYFNQKGPSFDAKRAFYHKLRVNENKGKKIVGNGYPFFAVLYYGDIRPDRYDTKHIYDTTFENDATIDKIDYVTFDILSILSNMLNPWHTYFRAGNSHFSNEELWQSNIEKKWGKYCGICSVKNNDVIVQHIPNSILPFYSVDMMLHYLKHQYKAKDIAKNYPKNIIDPRDIEKKLFIGGKDCCLERVINREKSLLKQELIKLNTLDEAQITKVIDELSIDENIIVPEEINSRVASIKNLIQISNADESDRNNVWRNIRETIINPIEEGKTKVLLSSNLDILQEIHECYNMTSFDCMGESNNNCCESIVNTFRNHVIAILLDEFNGSRKELNALIKELHKYTTISEIYKHLVNSLWVNAINETLIHGTIQEEIRRCESVANYYMKLWGETSKMLQIIARPNELKGMNKISEEEWNQYFIDKRNKEIIYNKIGNSKAILLYLDLFDEAKKVFIDEKH